MRSKIKTFHRLALLTVFAVVGMWGTLIAHAQPAGSIALVGLRLGECRADQFDVFFSLTAYSADNAVINAIDPYPVRVLVRSEYAAYSADDAFISGEERLLTGAFLGAPIAYVEVEAVSLNDFGVRSPIYRIFCADGSISIIQPPAPIVGDGRLNGGHGDLISVLYAGVDSTGKPGIKVYAVVGQRGIYAGMFTYADFEPYLNAPPAQNTLIKTVHKASLYALTSGEFQVNIGPDDEGKIGVVIFRALPVQITRREILKP